MASIKNKNKKRDMNEMSKDLRDDYSFNPSYIPKFRNHRKFVEAKIDMLRHQLCINITREDELYLYSFKTEHDINRAVKSIINKYWE